MERPEESPDPTERSTARAWRDACALAPGPLRQRVEQLRRELGPRLKRSEALAGGGAWVFDGTPQTRARLEHWIARERECCSGLRFELREGSEGLRLEVRRRRAAAAASRDERLC